MKKLVILNLLVTMSFISEAQKFVSTSPEKGNIIFEEYTGIHCGACPSGHDKTDEMIENAAFEIIPIYVHAGSVAEPQDGEPDFRTAYGEDLRLEMGVYGYPSATINRSHIGKEGLLAVFRNAWDASTRNESQKLSPVNVGVQSSFDEDSRELTVTVDLYYTSSSRATVNYINIAFLENGFIGPQDDFDVNSGTILFYVHNHILREMLTGQWGDAVDETFEGSNISRTYTYIVPPEYYIENCEIVAYVSESKQNIYNGHSIKANGGSTVIIGDLAYEKEYFSGKQGEETKTTISFTNELPDEETFTLYIKENTPEDWKAEVMIDGVLMNSGSEITIPANSSKSIDLGIVPGETVGIGSLQIEFASNTYDSKTSNLEYTMNLNNGVKDLIVLNYSALENSYLYEHGLAKTGNVVYGITTREAMIGFASENALDSVINIYYNVGRLLPALTDQTVAVLSDFMDGGGNLFIAGQDIGWSIFSESEFIDNSDVQRDFYTNYLHAEYLNDGTPESILVSAEVQDTVFGNCETIDILNSSSQSIYNTSPDEIIPINGGEAIFNYNEGTGIGGIRAETDEYKMVYWAVSLEQLGGVAAFDCYFRNVHDWFYGLIEYEEPEEEEEQLEEFETKVFPNPTTRLLNVTFENGLSSNRKVVITDLKGAIVLNKKLENDQFEFELNVENLLKGMYIVELMAEDTIVKREKIIML